MKKIKKITLLLLGFAFCILMACSKKEDVDREQFLGTWKGTAIATTETSGDKPPNSPTPPTTKSQEITIVVTKTANSSNKVTFTPQGTPQGNTPQGTPPQGTPPQGTPPQGTPPQGTPPQGTPPQGKGDVVMVATVNGNAFTFDEITTNKSDGKGGTSLTTINGTGAVNGKTLTISVITNIKFTAPEGIIRHTLSASLTKQ